MCYLVNFLYYYFLYIVDRYVLKIVGEFVKLLLFFVCCRFCDVMGGVERVVILWGNYSLLNCVEEIVWMMIFFIKKGGFKGWDDFWGWVKYECKCFFKLCSLWFNVVSVNFKFYNIDLCVFVVKILRLRFLRLINLFCNMLLGFCICI